MSYMAGYMAPERSRSGAVPPLAVTVLNRYDLLRTMLESLAAGSAHPSAILILDNGGGLRADIRKNRALPFWDRTEISVPPGGPGSRALGASWNEAIRWAAAIDPRLPVVISNDDLTWQRDAYAALVRGVRVGVADMATTTSVGGFVCFALTPEIVREIGYFDERFFPAYFEDEDYRYRMKLHGLYPRSVDEGCVVHHLESGSVQGMADDQKEVFKVHFQKNAMLYRQKWGGMVGEEQYTEPAL